MAVLDVLDRELPAPDATTALWWAAILVVEASMLGMYVAATGASLQPFHVYPFVWLNVGGWAVRNTTPAPAPRRRELLAAGAAVGYFLLLGYVGGLFGTGVTDEALRPGWRFATTLPPGYGPAVLYTDETVRLALSPYTLVGYIALTYLVYATVIDAAGSAVSGVLGLLSCLSCSWPILASIATGVAGGSSALVGAVYAQSYGLSTAVFVVTVGLLYWRPLGR